MCISYIHIPNFAFLCALQRSIKVTNCNSSVCLSVCLSVCRSVGRYVCRCVCLPVYLPVWFSACLPAHLLPARIHAHTSVYITNISEVICHWASTVVLIYSCYLCTNSDSWIIVMAPRDLFKIWFERGTSTNGGRLHTCNGFDDLAWLLNCTTGHNKTNPQPALLMLQVSCRVHNRPRGWDLYHLTLLLHIR